MENTIATDSNSESDISDSWAVIDDDSSFEWNNEMGLRPRQVIFEESEVPRTSSRSELSDEESIEVVADDHTDCLSDNEAEEMKSEKWTTSTDSGRPITGNVGQLENKGNKPTMPGTVENLIPNVQNAPLHPRKCVDCSTTPALIAIFVMGIVGGFAAVYSFTFYVHTSEDTTSKDSTSIQNMRTLIAKLQNENQFLRHQLRFAHSSLKFAVSNFPELKDSLQINFDNETVEGTFNGDNIGMCTITDFILQSHFRHGSVSADVCLASEKPQQNGHVLTMSENTYDAVSRLEDEVLPKTNTKILKVGRNNSESNGNEVNSWQIGEASSVPTEKSSVLANVSLHNETQHNKKVPQHAQNLESEIVNADVNNENKIDPRPFTKLRNIVEKIYAMVSVLGSDIQTTFPPKLELLNILPQNMVHLDFSVESLTSDNYKKIAAFKNQMQDSAQKLFSDIEFSIDRFMKNIANKFKKFERNNKQQICKLKRKLENSPDKDNIDWNKPFFQKCVDNQQNEHGDLINSKTKDNDPTLAIKKEFMIRTSASFHYKKPRDKHGVEKREGSTYNNENENTKHTLHLNKNFEFKEKSEVSHDGIDQSNNRLPEAETNILENKKSNKYDVHVQEKETYLKHKNKQVEPDRKLRKRKRKEDKQSKTSEKHTEFSDGIHEKYEKKKTFEDKERKYENNKDHKKMQKGKKTVYMDGANLAGDWTLKMAHGRAEQRRLEHQSDWVFDRAESRKSSRDRDSKNTYWYKREDYHANSDLCNKTKAFKDQASKAWKDVKHRVKENVWRPIVDTAKTAKRVFNNFNNYHSQRE